MFLIRNEDSSKAKTMANAVQMTGFQVQAARVENAPIAKLWVKFQQYRLFRKTMNELHALSGRELADLGLNRANIKSAAYAAVYGA